MTATAIQKRVSNTAVNPKYISWEQFQKKYLTREDSYKYEWLNGTVEKTKRTMDYTQLFILNNLMEVFTSLRNKYKFDGQLMSEGDIFFNENHRRPDIFYMTAKQIAYTAHGINQVPEFVIEVISLNDSIAKMTLKMQNYRTSGVKVVWHIHPITEEVHIYSGEYLDKMTVCNGNDICSAAPVLPDFKISAHDIFMKPALPSD
jgi:Uma2 family endonuclease